MALKINPATGLLEDMPEENPILGGLSAKSPVVQPQAPGATQPPPVAQDVEQPAIETPAPAPVRTEMLPVSTETTESKRVQTAATAKAEADRQNLFKREQDLAKEAGELGKAKAIAAQEEADEAVRLQEAKLKEKADLDAKRAKQEEADVANIQRTRDQVKNFKFSDGWSDRSTGNKVLAALMIGLGEIGKVYTGASSNSALNIINAQMDREYQVQKDQLKKFESESAGAVEDAANNRIRFADANARLDASFAGKMDNLLAVAKQRLAKLGYSEAEIAKNQLVLGLEQKANGYALDSARELAGVRNTKVESKLTTTDAEGRPIKPKDKEGEQSLRKEYNSLPITKDTNSMRSSVQRINSASDNAQGDLSLIYGYMKTLDPQSVVREGEFATAENSRGVPERIQNLYNKVINGERLTKEQRLAFKAEATKTLRKQEELQKQVDDQYANLAKESGFNPKSIITKIDVKDESTQTSQQDNKFPRTVRKNGEYATVSNQAEADEAAAEGWQ